MVNKLCITVIMLNIYISFTKISRLYMGKGIQKGRHCKNGYFQIPLHPCHHLSLICLTNFALLAVTHHWSLQLLLPVYSWKREHKEDNFICTKCEYVRNTQWWRHHLSKPLPSMSPLITIFGYPLTLGDLLLTTPKWFLASFLLVYS